MTSMVADSLWGSTPMITFATAFSRSSSNRPDGEVGSATTSWADPFRATPRHGVRRAADRKRATPRTSGGQPGEERSAGHLDRVWPDTDPARKSLVAGNG